MSWSWKEGLQLVCSAGNTAVNVHCRVTQILIEKHPEILPCHHLGRVVTTKSINGTYHIQHGAPFTSSSLPARPWCPHWRRPCRRGCWTLDRRAATWGSRQNSEMLSFRTCVKILFWNDNYFIGSLAFDLIKVRQLLELELIASVHDNLSLGETVLTDHV